MRTKQAEITLSAKVRSELEKIVGDGNVRQKVAKRAKLVLMTADGVGVMAIMRTVGVSKTTVWRWQEYFVEAGVAGVIKGRSKPPGKKADFRGFQARDCREDRQGAPSPCHALERAHNGGGSRH